MIPLDLTINERVSLLRDNQVTFYRDCVPSAPARAVDSRAVGSGPDYSWIWQDHDGTALSEPFKCPYGQHGDTLDLNGVTAVLAEPFPFLYERYSLWHLTLYLPDSPSALSLLEAQ
jgi:hypothetical protein